MKVFAIAVAAASLSASLGSVAQTADTPVAAPVAATPSPTAAASQAAREAALEASESASVSGREPAVVHTVIDDKTAHIDELRVRGQLQSVTVRPKGRLPEYEVLTGSGGRDLPEQGINRSSGL